MGTLKYTARAIAVRTAELCYGREAKGHRTVLCSPLADGAAWHAGTAGHA